MNLLLNCSLMLINTSVACLLYIPVTYDTIIIIDNEKKIFKIYIHIFKKIVADFGFSCNIKKNLNFSENSEICIFFHKN